MCERLRSCTPSIVWKRSLLETLPMLWREGLPSTQDADFIRRSLCHAEHGIWIEMTPAVHYRLDEVNSTGIYVTSMKDPLAKAKTNCFAFASAYQYCVEMGRMTDRLHCRYLQFLFYMFFFRAILSNNPSVVREYYNLVVTPLNKTFHDRCLRFTIEAVFISRPLFRWGGYLLGKVHPPIARRIAFLNPR
jgi:hypothetical protein